MWSGWHDRCHGPEPPKVGSDLVRLPRREGYLTWEVVGDNRKEIEGHCFLVFYKNLCAGPMLDAGAQLEILNSACTLESPGGGTDLQRFWLNCLGDGPRNLKSLKAPLCDAHGLPGWKPLTCTAGKIGSLLSKHSWSNGRTRMWKWKPTKHHGQRYDRAAMP